MRKYKTVYPFFESKIKEILKLVVSELLLEDRSPEFVVLLHKIKHLLEGFLINLEAEPSFNLKNLGQAINENYIADPSVHAITIRVEFIENPDMACSSFLIFKQWAA